MAIVKAALLLPSANRTAFVAQTCGGDQTMRREVLALLAHDWKPSNLTGGEIVRVSGLFHAAFSLPPDERAFFLDGACEGVPHLRREVEKLIEHALAPSFLEEPPALAADSELAALRLAAPVPPAPFAPPPAGDPPHDDPFIGRRVGPYIIQRRLGEGGMGVVYQALDVNLRKSVAIKVPRPRYARDPGGGAMATPKLRVCSGPRPWAARGNAGA